MTESICKICGGVLTGEEQTCSTCGAQTSFSDEQENPDTVSQTETDAENDSQTEEIPEEMPSMEQTIGTEPVPKKKNLDQVKEWFQKYKLYACIAGAALAVLILVIILVNAWQPSKYSYYEDPYYFYVTDESVLLSNQKNTITIDGFLEESFSSFSGEQGFLLIGDPAVEEEIFTLYDYAGNKIAEDVICARGSLNGKGIVFVQAIDENFSQLMHWYDGKIKTICEDFDAENSITISPNGKTIAYHTMNEDGEHYGYYYDGKLHELGKGILPVAIADSAKVVYYMKGDNAFVQKGDKTETRIKLGKNDSMETGFYNEDLTELLYSVYTDGDIKTYIVADANEKIQLKGELTEMLLPSNTFDWYGVAVGVSTFAETYYFGEGSVYYINKNYEAEKVTNFSDDNTQVQLCDDGKTLIYRRGDSIYKLNGTNAKADPQELVGDADSLIAITGDGSAMFYINEEDEIMFQKGTKKPQRVTDEYDRCAEALFDGKILYYIYDEELYQSSGSFGTVVEDRNLYNVYGVKVTQSYIQVYCYKKEYLSFDGKAFRELN